LVVGRFATIIPQGRPWCQTSGIDDGSAEEPGSWYRIFPIIINFMNKIFVTRSIPESGLQRLRSLFEVDVWLDRDPPPREVLLQRASGCSGVLSMLSDRIDDE
jgi:hypothetical protein